MVARGDFATTCTAAADAGVVRAGEPEAEAPPTACCCTAGVLWALAPTFRLWVGRAAARADFAFFGAVAAAIPLAPASGELGPTVAFAAAGCTDRRRVGLPGADARTIEPPAKTGAASAPGPARTVSGADAVISAIAAASRAASAASASAFSRRRSSSSFSRSAAAAAAKRMKAAPGSSGIEPAAAPNAGGAGKCAGAGSDEAVAEPWAGECTLVTVAPCVLPLAFGDADAAALTRRVRLLVAATLPVPAPCPAMLPLRDGPVPPGPCGPCT